MEIGAGPIQQANDGRLDVPHLVSSSRAKAHLRLRRVHAEAGAAPAVLPHQAVPGRGRAPDLAQPLGEDGERAGRDMTIFGRRDEVLDHPRPLRASVETGTCVDGKTDRRAHRDAAGGPQG